MIISIEGVNSHVPLHQIKSISAFCQNPIRYSYINFQYSSVAHCVFILLSDEPTGLQNLLGFVIGLDTIPSLGFDPIPRLRFHHPKAVDGYSGLPNMPYTNACANILTVHVLGDYDFLRNESL